MILPLRVLTYLLETFRVEFQILYSTRAIYFIYKYGSIKSKKNIAWCVFDRLSQTRQFDKNMLSGVINYLNTSNPASIFVYCIITSNSLDDVSTTFC